MGLRIERRAVVDGRRRPVDAMPERLRSGRRASVLATMCGVARYSPHSCDRAILRREGPGERVPLEVSDGDQNGMNSPGAPPRQASTNSAVSRTDRDWHPGSTRSGKIRQMRRDREYAA